MAKEAYYFPHDSNAQDDPKCMLLIDQLGMEGYGIFWALIEKLRNEDDYKLPLNITNSYAKRWGTSKEKIESVIRNYGLFQILEDYFFSARLARSMTRKTEKASSAATIRWEKYRDNQQLNANALQLDITSSADEMQNDAIKEKKRKEKERKEENIEIPFSDSFKLIWQTWKNYKKTDHKFSFKSEVSERASLKSLIEMSGNNEQIAIKIIDRSISNGWKGFFPLKGNTGNTSSGTEMVR